MAESANKQVPGADRKGLLLPDFCAPDSVITVVVITELVALVLTLARSDLVVGESFWQDLAKTSLFLLWIGLASSAVLCRTRERLARLPVPQATMLALGLLLVVTAVISEAGWWMGQYWDQLRLLRSGDPSRHLRFLGANLLTCLIVSTLALRYFYVAQQWRRNVQLEARSRVNALQARIRPAFPVQQHEHHRGADPHAIPRLAEEAVEDLADLFRASLTRLQRTVTLKEEMEMARIYQRIEQLRLGERLRCNWQVDGLAAARADTGADAAAAAGERDLSRHRAASRRRRGNHRRS